ncbi:LOW QUALITY PROTEIN: peripheral-type benzodiazepine receptor-associated protein 1 [Electrophorus electricus]|uniref:LOW QUALITY PROTEIN: peripheral-type benzodiazepine receptor-associated protein 1 n=1 Tax=Electrophorus electricus TaxID=8005 RepID=UPI0015D001F4|nr:LOW QUALITY PROTEIN: peripheral-type benzodiazepine receptor-associated protein 1 [Electrophorus electricus]
MGRAGANSNPRDLSSMKGSPCHKGGGGGPEAPSRSAPSPDPAWEVVCVQAKPEADRSRNQQAHRRFPPEHQQQQEGVRKEKERAAQELVFRPERQRASERCRPALARELLDGTTLWRPGELHSALADEITGVGADVGAWQAQSEPGCLGNGRAYRKLEELLEALHGEARGEQAALLRCLRQEVELERSYFVCHLLEAHGHSTRGEEEEKRGTDGEGRTHRPRSKSCANLLSTVPPRSGQLLLTRSCSLSQKPQHTCLPPTKWSRQTSCSSSEMKDTHRCSLPVEERTTNVGSSGPVPERTSPDAGWDPPRSSPSLEKSSPSRCSEDTMDDMSGTDYGFLVRQNAELLRALEELENTCSTLREDNILLRKSSCPETEEKVRRLRRKNAELAVLAKRLEERAHKLQEANLKVVNSPIPIKVGAVEQYKRAFARQRARDLALHADTLLSKDKEIATLQRQCRQLEAKLGQGKDSPGPSGEQEVERLLKESQKEVLRLQRQLSVTSVREQVPPGGAPPEAERNNQMVGSEKLYPVVVDEALVKGETTGEEEESGTQSTPRQDTSSAHQEGQTQEDRLQFLESELSKKRKECEDLEHEARKRQKRCLDLESQLEDAHSKNECLTEEADFLKRKVQLLDQYKVENEELRGDLAGVNARHSCVLEENQRLRAKLENLEQVLKHMREVAERRQHLELEHEQALAVLKFKQEEITRLQRAQLFAKREHEGVVQMLEGLVQLVLLRELNTLDCMQAKVRDLEEKCRTQGEQFGLLSQELEKFRLQASKMDLSSPGLLCAGLPQLPNGLGLSGDAGASASWDDIAFWSLEGTEALCDVTEQDVATTLGVGSSPRTSVLSRSKRSPSSRRRALPGLSPRSASSSSPSPPKSDTAHLSPKSATDSRPASPRKASPTHEVDTASEVEELDIDVSPAPFSASRGGAKLHVFIARYSYNPYDGPNDNPEVELPLTAGEYIYVYGDMDDDGFYEGELMDGRRGLVPSNFVERVSDDDVMSAHLHDASDLSHSSFQESSFYSGSERFHQHHRLRFVHSGPDRTEASAANDAKAGASPFPATLPNGLDADLEEDAVPYPRKLTLIKQLARSVIVGWEPPPGPAAAACSYNVYVDQELRLTVPPGGPTKAVLERLDVARRAYRVAVQSLTERGASDRRRCTLLVGRGAGTAPSQLRAELVAATSARLSWMPADSSLAHVILLDGEERELAAAGRCSANLSGLVPSRRYSVEVESRPPGTAGETRERRSAVTTFTTLVAGPPDAPLDVQLEQGPSPGIVQISWLPVTIDAAGTSNGVRVTGYTIYADKKKVLEVSSPTAGSALIGPSQIQTLQAAQEITVRTMSPHGESADSVPVDVPARMPGVVAGASVQPYQPMPAHASAHTLEPAVCANPLFAAKTPTMPLGYVPDAHRPTPVRGIYADKHVSATDDAPRPAASYAEAWANPALATPLLVAMAAQEAQPLTVASANPSQVVVPVVVPTPVPVSVPGVPTAAPAPASPTLQAPGAPRVTAEPSSETDRSGAVRPMATLSDFLEEPHAKLHTPPPIPSVPSVTGPGPDPLSTPGAHTLQSPNPSPEPEDGREIPRLVSIEEFLRPEPQPKIKVYTGGLLDPPPDYRADSSRSDLSDILEEEEDELYSESAAEGTSRNSNSGPAGELEEWERDSDEELMENILKLQPGAHHDKKLFSIPEVTEEEDFSESESHSRPLPSQGLSRYQPAPGESHRHGRETCQRSPAQQQNRDEVPQLTAKIRPKARYTRMVAAIDDEDEEDVELDPDSGLDIGSSRREAGVQRPRQAHRDGDRLLREALPHSNMTSDPATLSGASHRSCGRTMRHIGCPAPEIDVEYGTDDDEQMPFDLGEMVVEQMSCEWWVEGRKRNCHHVPLPRWRREPPASVPPVMPTVCQHSWEAPGRADVGVAWLNPGAHSLRASGSGAGPPGVSRPVGENEVRIFVALFPYDPATMSPNRDASEEELPFREGQIIKVYGDKDADGFYRGKSGGRHGYVPCNMVSEIQVDDEETRDQLLQQGFLSTDASMEKIGARTLTLLPHRPAPPPKPRRSKKVESAGEWEVSSFVDASGQDNTRHCAVAMENPAPRRMVAIFDYDPSESSPNADIEAELTFRAGDVIYVLGDMDDDGFFYGDLNGRKGLVPSNFLQAFSETSEVLAAAEDAVADSYRDLPKVNRCSLSELTDPAPTPAEEGLLIGPEPRASPDPELEPQPDPSATPAPVATLLPPGDNPSLTDASPPGKKKKSFFSKGKKLFKKLGSSKRE